MPRVTDVVPLWGVDGVVDALTDHERLTYVGPGSVYCPRVTPSQGLCLAHMSSGLGLYLFCGSDLFTPSTDTRRSFFRTADHLVSQLGDRLFRLHEHMT